LVFGFSFTLFLYRLFSLLSLLCFTSGGLSIYHVFLSTSAMMKQRHQTVSLQYLE